MEFIIGMLLYFFGRWFYFRVKEYQIMHPHDGTTFIQIIKENLKHR